jgi:hypothetical protein
MITPHTEKTKRKFDVQSKNTDPFSKNTDLSVSLIKKYLNSKEIVRELKINNQELLKCYQTDDMAQKIYKFCVFNNKTGEDINKLIIYYNTPSPVNVLLEDLGQKIRIYSQSLCYYDKETMIPLIKTFLKNKGIVGNPSFLQCLQTDDMTEQIYNFCVSKQISIGYIKRLIEYWNNPKSDYDKELDEVGKQILKYAKPRCDNDKETMIPLIKTFFKNKEFVQEEKNNQLFLKCLQTDDMAEQTYNFCISNNISITFIKRLFEYWNNPKSDYVKNLDEVGKQIFNFAKSRCDYLNHPK